MNKQLKRVTRVIFLMFIVLCFSTTMIQVVQADELRANPVEPDRDPSKPFLLSPVDLQVRQSRRRL